MLNNLKQFFLFIITRIKKNFVAILLFLLGMVLSGIVFSFVGIIEVLYSDDYYIYNGQVYYNVSYDCEYETDRYGNEQEIGCREHEEVIRYVDEVIKDKIKFYGFIGFFWLGLFVGAGFVSLWKKIQDKSYENI